MIKESVVDTPMLDAVDLKIALADTQDGNVTGTIDAILSESSKLLKIDGDVIEGIQEKEFLLTTPEGWGSDEDSGSQIINPEEGGSDQDSGSQIINMDLDSSRDS